ncbi:hypothetical protein [Hominenteromicrobium sp.]|jgi:hypothetical protein|uniref:hypothetical protein n=1 Tax=Hominenteromicrobium sp. TaxID=3073581 RepID=UPI003A903026
MAKYMSKKDVVFYIRKEAEEAQSAFEELGGESGIIAEAFEDLANELEDFPATDVAPVRHGKWVHSRYENCSEQFEMVKCSCCGREAYAMAFYVRDGNYCPNCGAKMDG